MRDSDTTSPSSQDDATGATKGSDRSSRRRRSLLSLALAGGIALGGAGIAQAASNADAPAATSSTSSSATPATPGAPDAGKTAPGAKDGAATPAAGQDGQRPTPPAPPAGGPEAPGPASGQDGEGVVSAVDASSLTLTERGGDQITYTLDEATTIHQGPARGQDGAGSLTADDISAGQRVHVRATEPTDNGEQPTAADVDVHPAHIDGVVTDVTDASLTVSDRDGFTRTIATDADTSYGRDGQGSASEITAGTPVRAQGAVASDGTTLAATNVEVDTGPAGGPAGPGGHGPGEGGAPGGPAAPGQDAPPAPGTTAPDQGGTDAPSGS